MEKTLKGYYFSQIEEAGFGPRNKVKSQINTFKKSGIELELVESPTKLTGKIRGNFILRQLVCRLPFTYVYSKHIYKNKYKNADVYYIRFVAGDYPFTKFLKKLRKNNPDAVIIMEFADFPTTWYMTTSLLYTVLYSPIIFKDWIAGLKYRKYIDRIVVPKNIEQAYGISVISFMNGIDIKSIKPRETQERNEISIIGVAGMCNFHGYDRIIKGLGNYYKNGGKREVKLHFVGGKDAPGNELENYKNLTKQFGLEKKIIFYGMKTGEDLDKIYNLCNLAVGSLGMYRIGYESAGSLKSREYLAKGLPIITGCKIDIFENSDFKYYIEFPNDDSDIDIDRVIDFYDDVYSNKTIEGLSQEIRNYAEARCDADVVLKPIIDYIIEQKLEKII